MPPQANPNPSGCLGVFGLSLYTSERDLRDVFSRYGPISEVKVVFDQQTGRSRGFAFVYFETDTDAKEVSSRKRWCSVSKKYCLLMLSEKLVFVKLKVK